MKQRINRGFLIVSIAMSLVIFGMSIALTYWYGYEIGLPCGLGAFLLLIGVMLLLNHRSKKKGNKKPKKNASKKKKS